MSILEEIDESKAICRVKVCGLLANQLKQNLMRFTSINWGFLDEIQWVFEGLGQFWESQMN